MRYPVPTRQSYVGALVDQSPIITNAQLPFVGQLGPGAAERIAMSHGRRLAGFGDTATPAPVPWDDSTNAAGDEPDWHDGAMQDLESEDDVVGSGIFDAAGRTTVHEEMGVFQDHPSIPGYIDRHPPFTVNEEVRDVVTGGPTVEVPGGGMSYVERWGRPAPVPTLRMGGGYAVVGTPTSASRPLVSMSPASRAYAPQPVPMAPAQTTTFITGSVPFTSTANIATTARAVGAVEEPASSGWGSWLFGGIILGVAAGLAAKTMGKGR